MIQQLQTGCFTATLIIINPELLVYENYYSFCLKKTPVSFYVYVLGRLVSIKT